ncbi:3-oxoacyl-(acyl-carrier-protein) reductase FabG [Rhodococcus sp. RD6.2]|uniref:SDR family NAD(P)-dependent oxidoreductase n=1 Tax=Rhodococcus sp. RD6.2 TaxID=260936 RepID=UPI00063BB29A|nr:SDR family oxidoreductase [Rhodococcus sp. RD6.2]CRK53285.1 3-oxoacyl-(acyl-carrier-protein) reductase FabG [Rhodococcus sp. RD6.2]
MNSSSVGPATGPRHGTKVVVTGAAGGIGAALVGALVALGCEVVGIDRPGTSLPDGVVSIPLLEADLADDAAAAAAVERAVSLLGGLDCLIGAAASVASVHRAGSFSPSVFRHDIESNLLSQFWTAQAAYPALVASSNANLVLFSSTGALDGLPGQVSYGAAKAGVLGLVRTLAAEWADSGIRVNAIVPGLVATPKVLAMPAETRERVLRTVAMKRLVEVDEVVASVLFLMSSGAGAITGQSLRVDGGAGINTQGLYR